MGLTSSTAQNQSGPGSNGDEGVLHTPQIYKTQVLLTDAV